MRKKLRSTMIDVRDSVQMVHAASDEIARGNVDLSTRTESQASTLEQTTSSMQLLSDTVRSNAQHAQEASGLAAQTSHSSHKPGACIKTWAPCASRPDDQAAEGMTTMPSASA